MRTLRTQRKNADGFTITVPTGGAIPVDYFNILTTTTPIEGVLIDINGNKTTLPNNTNTTDTTDTKTPISTQNILIAVGIAVVLAVIISKI